jgi:hypothetical protein
LNVWQEYVYAVEPETGTAFPTPLVLPHPPSGQKQCAGASTPCGSPFDVLVDVSGFLN